jgi:hypothetical protein
MFCACDECINRKLLTSYALISHTCQHTPSLFAWVISPNANNVETTAETNNKDKHTKQSHSNIQHPNWESNVLSSFINKTSATSNICWMLGNKPKFTEQHSPPLASTSPVYQSKQQHLTSVGEQPTICKQPVSTQTGTNSNTPSNLCQNRHETALYTISSLLQSLFCWESAYNH